MDPEREQAFARFVEDHQDRAFRLALRLVSGDRAAAEDIVQEAMIRAHRGLSQFRGEARLSTWFDRILVREAYRHYRRPWRRWLPGEEPEAHVGMETPAAGDPFLRRRIEAALSRLSPKQRTVFVLVHLEGRSLKEAAQVMGRAEGTLKSHLHRALVSLRAELGAFVESGSGAKPDESGEGQHDHE